MKPGIHPTNYRPVVFHDVAIDKRWIMMSTVETHETTVWEDGRTYPLYRVETSMYSHPFYTGIQRIVDAEGRVEKFNKKYKLPGRKDQLSGLTGDRLVESAAGISGQLGEQCAPVDARRRV